MGGHLVVALTGGHLVVVAAALTGGHLVVVVVALTGGHLVVVAMACRSTLSVVAFSSLRSRSGFGICQGVGSTNLPFFDRFLKFSLKLFESLSHFIIILNSSRLKIINQILFKYTDELLGIGMEVVGWIDS
jgi:hypothetical protein